jgi:hypothetical protein
MNADSRTPVQQPLTLILTMKSDDDFQKLSKLLEEAQSNPDSDLRKALDGIETVHFARFVFLENNTKLAVITTYDGDLDTYLNAFVRQIGKLFDTILHHVSPAPPTPVEEFPGEFIDFIKRHDMKATGAFYSAYPGLTVKHIKALSPGVTT